MRRLRRACADARSRDPLLRPEERYEREGLMPDVGFTCGLARDGDRRRLYDGAAVSVDAVLAGLEPTC